MKKNFFILLLSTLIALGVNAQGFEWAKRVGGTGLDLGRSIITDASGNVYTTGIFGDATDFDPGPGTFNLTPAGGWDIFISKLDALGNFVWAKQLGGIFNDSGNSIATDFSGNIYITGNFEGIADFDPGISVFNLSSAGLSDIFIVKLDSMGDFIWAISMEGVSDGIGYSITAEASGSVYITGYFQGVFDFDPGVGVYNLSSAGDFDIFISKLDDSGNFVWAKRIGGMNNDAGYSITTDSSGNVYTTGSFRNTVDFDPGSGSFNLTSAGSTDIFISKLDLSGNFVWAKKMGGTDIDVCGSIITDASGNVYTTGSFQGNADFDPGPSTFNLTSAGQEDIFISKLDPFGNFVWAKRIGGISFEVGRSITTDISGNLYTTGRFMGTADFDPGIGAYNLSSAGDFDIFISKLDALGNFVWAKKMGGLGKDDGFSIATDTLGNLYTTGTFNGTVDFNPDAGVFNLSSAGYDDVFIHKLSYCQYITANILQSFCDSYTSPSGNYVWTVSGNYLDTLLNFVGCDSVITINLTIKYSNAGTQTTTACNSYTWSANNTTYTSSGYYTATLTNISGCDSVVTLNLTIIYTNTSSQTVTTCNSYTSPSGNYIWTNSGTYLDTVSNYLGCDSVITINLTINTVDTSVSINNNELISNATGATYQWADCNNSYAAIPGETNQTFTPSVNGSYAIIVTQNGCTDTSACYTISNVGITELANGNIKIYPNPTNGLLYIEVEEAFSCTIYNNIGKLVYSNALLAGNNTLQLPELAAGVYIIKLYNGTETYTEKLVIEQK